MIHWVIKISKQNHYQDWWQCDKNFKLLHIFIINYSQVSKLIVCFLLLFESFFTKKLYSNKIQLHIIPSGVDRLTRAFDGLQNKKRSLSIVKKITTNRIG